MKKWFLLGFIALNSQLCLAKPQTTAQMQQEIARLNALVEQLRNQLKNEPNSAAPINLGRTSLAAVSASSVNGNRDLANQYYGIPNAFDGGENWVNSLNYSSWLASGEASPWAEVAFDVPVTLSSISVDGGPPFSTQLFFAKGGEQNFPQTSGQLKLEKPLGDVSKVRLNFFGGGGNLQVQEIRVLGFVPPQTKYETRKPRVLMTRQNAIAIAQNAHREWHAKLAPAAAPEVVEEGGEYILTFKHAVGNYPIFRVVLNQKTGAVSSQSLAELAPLP